MNACNSVLSLNYYSLFSQLYLTLCFFIAFLDLSWPHENLSVLTYPILVVSIYLTTW